MNQLFVMPHVDLAVFQLHTAITSFQQTLVVLVTSISAQSGRMRVWQPGSLFKVIGINEKSDKTQITLLEVPEAFMSELTTKHLSEMEEFYANQAETKFHYALLLDALPVHQTRDWLSRMKFPIGIDDNGLFFECWRYKN